MTSHFSSKIGKRPSARYDGGSKGEGEEDDQGEDAGKKMFDDDSIHHHHHHHHHGHPPESDDSVQAGQVSLAKSGDGAQVLAHSRSAENLHKDLDLRDHHDDDRHV